MTGFNTAKTGVVRKMSTEQSSGPSCCTGRQVADPAPHNVPGYQPESCQSPNIGHAAWCFHRRPVAPGHIAALRSMLTDIVQLLHQIGLCTMIMLTARTESHVCCAHSCREVHPNAELQGLQSQAR